MARETRAAHSCWIKKGDNVYLPSDNVEVADELAAGAYKVSYSHREETFIVTRVDIQTDDLIDLPQPEMEGVMQSVTDFYDQKNQFKEWGFVFKRGFLLYGVPGGGKTSIISNIIKYVVEKMNGVAFVIYNLDDLEYYSRFMSGPYREIEPDRVILTIFEDIDGMTKNETLLINVLDGLGNSNNVLNIATTNYTERLSDRIVNRPNRFDRRIEIKSPNAEAREYYLKHKILPQFSKNIDFKEWVSKTEGMTLAQMSELIKSVFLLNQSFVETIETLKGMKKVPSSSSYNKDTLDTVGFNTLGVKPVVENEREIHGIIMTNEGRFNLTREEYDYYIKFGTILDTAEKVER